MKLTINLDDVDLSDYFDENGAPTLSEVFKNEFMDNLVSRFRFDNEIQIFVKRTIGEELANTIRKYKDEAILKAIVEDVVSARINDYNKFFFSEQDKEKIQKSVEAAMDGFTKEVERKAIINARKYVATLAKDFFADYKLNDFIDYKKITDRVIYLLESKTEDVPTKEKE